MEQTKSKDESEKKNVYLPSMTQPNKSKKYGTI